MKKRKPAAGEPFRYISVCSGIEAASVAWDPLGWEPGLFAEIEKFPSAVLAHRFPGVPNAGDMTQYKKWEKRYGLKPGTVDLLVGGTPCQSFSVAGLRGGLDDARGNLALTFCGIMAHYRPRWVVWENVPGVLSSTSHEAPDPNPPQNRVGIPAGERVEVVDEYRGEEGRDFECILAGFSELGYGIAYRVLDAQFYGVAQRRRRTFVVGHAGGCWQRAAAVLFDRASLRGDPAPRRGEGEGTSAPVVGSLTGSGRGVANCGETRGQDPVVAEREGGIPPVANTLTARMHKGVNSDLNEGQTLCCFTQNTRDEVRAIGGDGEIAGALAADAGAKQTNYVAFRTTPNNGAYPTGERTDALATGTDRTQAIIVEDSPAPPLTTRPYGDNPSKESALIPECIGFNSDQSEKTRRMGEREEESPTLRAGGQVAVAYAEAAEVAPTLGKESFGPQKCSSGQMVDFCIAEEGPGPDAYALQGGGKTSQGSQGSGWKEEQSFTLNCIDEHGVAARQGPSWRVRRLTPRECERLQGFPDDWTLVPGLGTGAPDPEMIGYFEASGYGREEAEALAKHPDGPRYKALGNSMAVPVMRWIGARIAMLERLLPWAESDGVAPSKEQKDINPMDIQ